MSLSSCVRFMLVGFFGVSAAASLLFVDPAEAIPAFARKYRFSCTTCHAPAPRLKAFGEEFAGRGFRLEDPAQEPARATLDVGDPLLQLPRDLQLAVRLEGFASWKEEREAETDFETPWVFKILSGGPIHDNLSYYFYFLVERGEVVGLEDAYLQIGSPFGIPVDVLFGQFQVCDPLFKREVRLSREDYHIYKARVGKSIVNLTYDRGVVVGGALPGEIDAVLQVVNGNGIHEADEHHDFDEDANKNVSLRFARAIGPVRVGAFGYYGKQSIDPQENETIYYGPDVLFDDGGPIAVSAQYLERVDDDPRFSGSDDDEWTTRGGFLEVHWFPEGQDGRWVLTALYNQIERDDDDPAADLQIGSLTVSRLLARNFRLLGEGAYDAEAERGRFTIGLVAAF
ncbi:MAG: hypothetical protein GF346_12350 [Candidatus Eisenbacteria bacterium]|nr:hypothetical protein [Candidatus Latescibacterota bacterium]MBD3303227.1 hypothetical protein [Candidatus Eisenbacteria bacterium]